MGSSSKIVLPPMRAQYRSALRHVCRPVASSPRLWPAWSLDLALRNLSGTGNSVMHLVKGIEHAFSFVPVGQLLTSRIRTGWFRALEALFAACLSHARAVIVHHFNVARVFLSS